MDYLHLSHILALDDYEAVASLLAEELPWTWRQTYIEQTTRGTHLVRIQREGFEFLYDNYSSLIQQGAPASDIEDRLVAVHGRSQPAKRPHEASRMKGWVGPTEVYLGKNRDKGHFIARTLGGIVDGLELNVFPQLRALNRGWSLRGKLFRSMERYCATHPGTYCFNHPIYTQASAVPCLLEFGVLTVERELWVETFSNHP